MHEPLLLAGTTVAYLFVHDENYPRNRLVREHFAGAGADVDLYSVEALGLRNPLSFTYIRKLIGILSRYDLAVVSEFQLRYALAVGIAAKFSRTKLVVDGFVGRYETAVGDWGQVSSRSLKSVVYRVIDASSLVVSDLFLLDNEFRADRIRHGVIARLFRKQVTAVPVGSPAWAHPQPQADGRAEVPTSPVKALYYGNYIPLHGVEVLLAGIAEFTREQPIEVIFIGNGVHRNRFEIAARDLGLNQFCDFRDSVDENDLGPIIRSTDIVFGIFGDSPKAKSVIANKVWQGLATGKRVLTRESPALQELHFISEDQLIQVTPSPTSIADALRRIAETKSEGQLQDFLLTHINLKDYVNQQFIEFIGQVHKEIKS